jgi:hypothetical protein
MPDTQPMTLDERYVWIRDRMDFARMASVLSQIPNVGFQHLVKRISQLGIMIGADTGLTPAQAMEMPRLGLTIVLPARPPLIWINLQKHVNSEEKLADTTAHEAIHATSGELGRHDQLPEPEDVRRYNGEEICALVGANTILREIEFPARTEIARNKKMLRDHAKILEGLNCTKRFLSEREGEGKSAAHVLLDN